MRDQDIIDPTNPARMAWSKEKLTCAKPFLRHDFR
jgi:hypothetical protein